MRQSVMYTYCLPGMELIRLTMLCGAAQLLVSVAAGVSTEKLGQQFGPGWRVARAMPNTAVRVREGATVFCLGAGTDQQDSETIQTLFSAVGLSAQVLESQIGIDCIIT